MASKSQLDTALRVRAMSEIVNALSPLYDTDVLEVGASELAMPVVDEEGNEKWILIKVSIPRGTRNGEGGYDPYDGYAAHEEYVAACESKAQERAVKRAMKAADKGKKVSES